MWSSHPLASPRCVRAARSLSLQTPQDLPIPQLSVMGDQSSGKSSVLEFLSGVPFPRGTGLVTRCATQYVDAPPLLLSHRASPLSLLFLYSRGLSFAVDAPTVRFRIRSGAGVPRKTSGADANRKRYGCSFLSRIGVACTPCLPPLLSPLVRLTMKRVPGISFRGKAELRSDRPQPDAAGPILCKADVASKIERLTEAAVGDGVFSNDTVLIEIEAPDVPDLTIIDLPGLVRTTTAGQSKSIIKQVDSLVQRYLESERTIILAVVPATVDIATSDILERAHQVRFEKLLCLFPFTVFGSLSGDEAFSCWSRSHLLSSA